MTARIDAMAVSKDVFNGMFTSSKYLAQSNIDKQLRELVSMRASQINGCVYCLNMHGIELRHSGYPQRNLDVLAAWRESDFFSERERAALAWTDAVTRLTDQEVPDAVFQEVRKVFDEKDLVDLTLAITVINTFNRFNVAFQNPADANYTPGQWG